MWLVAASAGLTGGVADAMVLAVQDILIGNSLGVVFVYVCEEY